MHFSTVGHTAKAGSQSSSILYTETNTGRPPKRGDKETWLKGKSRTKTAEKELNKMEMGNPSDAEFKTLVIRMLEELTGYCNGLKKTQAEMKVTLAK